MKCLELTERHKKFFAGFYLLCFLISYAWYFFNGILFSGFNPVFFVNKPDITGNLFMLSGIQHLLVNSTPARILFDWLYLFLPLLLTYMVFKRKKGQSTIAIITSVFSMVYNYYFSILCMVSIEVLAGWMLLPLVLAGRSNESYYYHIHCVRILFITFFFSAALWKIRGGGLFNGEQMSAILIQQHVLKLSSGVTDWYTNMIRWLIEHKNISYGLYVSAFVLEFAFIAGYFTLRFDRILIILFCLFVVFNMFIMEISYFNWIAYLGCLYLSGYKIREQYNQKAITALKTYP